MDDFTVYGSSFDVCLGEEVVKGSHEWGFSIGNVEMGGGMRRRVHRGEREEEQEDIESEEEEEEGHHPSSFLPVIPDSNKYYMWHAYVSD